MRVFKLLLSCRCHLYFENSSSARFLQLSYELLSNLNNCSAFKIKVSKSWFGLYKNYNFPVLDLTILKNFLNLDLSSFDGIDFFVCWCFFNLENENLDHFVIFPFFYVYSEVGFGRHVSHLSCVMTYWIYQANQIFILCIIVLLNFDCYETLMKFSHFSERKTLPKVGKAQFKRFY